ncbi:MAG: hypothetical protein JW750_03355 [Anaerolineaceae bacterium]|nr:hypothetical protein [Anaerolineaceae bacterium]
MLEYPEIVTIQKQMRQELIGKEMWHVAYEAEGRKFVFCGQPPSEFSSRLANQTITDIDQCGNYLYLVTDQQNELAIGDTGGKLLFHRELKTIPAKRDLMIEFTDGCVLTHSVQMWGFMNAFSHTEAETHRHRILDEARPPLPDAVSDEEFLAFLAVWDEAPKVSAKKFITGRKYVTGLGNGYAQDILWRAKIHPRRKMDTLSEQEAKQLLASILDVVDEAVRQGGRSVERDFYNQPGGYEPQLGRATLGNPCPVCGTEIVKFSFEGGASYICPACQQI